jgi:hypothetical protein
MTKTRCTAAALAVGLMAHGATLAQSTDRPWYVGLTQDFSYQSNVFGTSSGEVDDTVSTTSLRGGFNVPLGRQRAYANATLSHQRYKDLSDRDNNGYSVGAGLDWATIEKLSGSLRLNSQRRQADFNVGGIVPVSISNLERSDEVALRAQLGGDGLLTLEGGIGHRQVHFSADEYAAREYKQDNGNFGIVYRPSGILSLNTGVSAADTRYLAPEAGQPSADRNRRRDVYIGANWVPTGASTVNARVSFGKTEYDRATAADFEGVTGSLSWNWRPSGRLALVTTLSRDSGQESGFLRLVEGAVVSATDFSRVTNRAALSAQYELTGKVTLSAGLSYARRTLVDGFTGVGGRDNTTAASVGARWAATRVLAFGCDASRESRSASGVGSSDYDNDRFGCFGSVTLD